MKAAVYRGKQELAIETVDILAIGEGEVLVRIDTCGICGTDLKKIETGLVPPPRIFGHEMAGTITEIGKNVKSWKVGDRVAVYHHIPCKNCYYCSVGAYAQCETYKKVGTTAGFVPSGGGFAEYIRVMDWIVEKGMAKIPDKVSFEEASFLEPVNTCVKAIKRARVSSGQAILIIGQGPIGLILLQLARREGARVFTTDVLESRLEKSVEFGAEKVYNSKTRNILEDIKQDTGGRGVDTAIVATANNAVVRFAFDAVRPGGQVMLFAQTKPGDMCSIDLGAVCALEKSLIGSYSASVDVNKEVEDLVFNRKINVKDLVTHRFGLEEINQAIDLATRPTNGSLKIVVKPDSSM